MKTKLFCLPYAGGSCGVYRTWKDHLHPGIELVPIEFAGRGTRIKEPLYERRCKAVQDVFHAIKSDIERSPYMLYGHSLGALIGYELVHNILANEFPQPEHLFFSGSSAPHLRSQNKQYHLLNDQDFKKKLMSLGGTPPEFFKHQELLDFYLPLLKNDFRLAETDIPGEKIHPLEANLTVMFGTKDDLTKEQCYGWIKHTSGNCELYFFEGGHFFINKNVRRITAIINATYKKLLS